MYRVQYAALPTNTQFGDRGVKELEYITLERRNEAYQYILDISQGKRLPKALALGRGEIQSTGEAEDGQLQGKKKSRVLMRKFHRHNNKIKQMCASRKRNGHKIVNET